MRAGRIGPNPRQAGARSTTSTVPRVPVTVTRVPAGASGPSAAHRVSPTRTLPRPPSIACSTTSERPTYCWPRTLRSGRSLIATSGRAYRFTQNTTATETRTNASTCNCQTMPVESASTPITAAARPNHRKCTPGMIVSRIKSSTARISQFHAPRPYSSAKRFCMVLSPTTDAGARGLRLGAWYAARACLRARRRPRAVLAECLAGDLGKTGNRAYHARRIERHHQHLLVGRLGQCLQRLHIVVGDEVVDGLHVAG